MVLHGAPGFFGVCVAVGVAVLTAPHCPPAQLPDVQSVSLLHCPPEPFCAVQTPGEPVMSQRWPVGHDDDPQQTLSTQFPD